MNSPIKLPPLPNPLKQIAWLAGKPQDVFGRNEMIAYAEQAVREALEQAAVKAVETLKNLTTEMEGYSYFGSNPGVKEDDYDDVAKAISTLIPENNHGDSS